MTALIDVEIRSVQRQSGRVNSYELVALSGQPLPAATAGSHIDVHLPVSADKTLIRQYSLCQDGSDPAVYRLGIQREAESKGGSSYIHEHWKVGTRLQISTPRNLFELNPEATHSVLLGGGIGITPVMAMAWQLHAAGKSFELHYSVRSLADAAFIGELQQAPFASRVHVYLAEDNSRLDPSRVLSKPGMTTHLYACGPIGYMDFIWEEAQALGWANSQLHREYFDAPEPQAESDETPFRVRLNQSGAEYDIPADQSVAEVLMAAGVDIPLSCEKGICGSCLTRVIDGIPDHRDLYQTEEEQAANDQFTPCCSRSKSPLLVLDL
ncbi:PDR/VanB family oxidoreductase [Oceanobacter mangrovi]|uniref:PDR/VanB family oxidoreductase n=1 Tax=Oceanobacter mangrovi TaxID=2862510 RepID=UPI001C8DF13C|nr:PDR/VanB family oxidoreductase [Oceanobacter mangrovi]